MGVELLKIKFLGGSKTVTGSCHMITTENKKVLLDCGQFQGGKTLEQMNHLPFDFDPSEIDFLFLSHSHIDHSGRIPLLVKRGFRGKIYCTKATYDLANIMLQDSGYIHEKEAEWENRKRARAGKESIQPLYTYEDAVYAIKYFEPVLYDQMITISDSIKVRFKDAGHILGSAIIELWITEKDNTSKVVFSGDLGMKNKPILRDPSIIGEADYLIMETTYGDRLHKETGSRIDILMDIILRTSERGGTVVIPSFAVGRTQEIIYELNKFYEYNMKYQKVLDDIHVYVDSPLATSATEIFAGNAQVFDEETKNYILSGDNPLDFKNLHFTRSTEESIALNNDPTPKIIISASGMCDAGRIKHHLKHHLWQKESSIVFVGYQANGTLGRRIKDGEKDVKIFGESIHINAEIYNIEGFSGHADQEGLLEWLSYFNKPKAIFLVHGETDSIETFAEKVKNKFNYDCIVVDPDQEYELNHDEKNILPNIEKETVDIEELDRLSYRMYTLGNRAEAILYQLQLAMSNETTQSRFDEINNKVIELEKDLMNLGIVIGNEDR